MECFLGFVCVKGGREVRTKVTRNIRNYYYDVRAPPLGNDK